MWWSDTLMVGIAPNSLSVAKANRSGKPVAGSAQIIAVAGETAATHWAPAVQAFAAHLAQNKPRSGAVRVVLSGHFVRWKLLTPPAGINRQRELAAFGTHAFAQTYGDMAQSWRVQTAELPQGWPVPACAIDNALLEALAAACAQAKLRLLSVSPYFSAAFDHWRGKLKQSAHWFCLAEPKLLTLGLVLNGRWAGLQARNYDAEPGQLLRVMQAQLALPLVNAMQMDGAALHWVGRETLAEATHAVLHAPPAAWPEDAALCRMAFGV